MSHESCEVILRQASKILTTFFSNLGASLPNAGYDISLEVIPAASIEDVMLCDTCVGSTKLLFSRQNPHARSLEAAKFRGGYRSEAEWHSQLRGSFPFTWPMHWNNAI